MNAYVGQTFQMNQLIDLKKVMDVTSISRSMIYALMNEKSNYYDPTFPKSAKIMNRRIVWSAWEINQWIESRLAARDNKEV